MENPHLDTLNTNLRSVVTLLAKLSVKTKFSGRKTVKACNSRTVKKKESGVEFYWKKYVYFDMIKYSNYK